MYCHRRQRQRPGRASTVYGGANSSPLPDITSGSIGAVVLPVRWSLLVPGQAAKGGRGLSSRDLATGAVSAQQLFGVSAQRSHIAARTRPYQSTILRCVQVAGIRDGGKQPGALPKERPSVRTPVHPALAEDVISEAKASDSNDRSRSSTASTGRPAGHRAQSRAPGLTRTHSHN